MAAIAKTLMLLCALSFWRRNRGMSGALRSGAGLQFSALPSFLAVIPKYGRHLGN